MHKNLLLGTLEAKGYVTTESNRILLTTTAMQSSQSPESEALEITTEDVGKTALIRGYLFDDVLYAAEIMQVLPPVSTALLETLLDKEVISYEEFMHKLSDIQTEVHNKHEKKKLCALVIGHKKYSPGAINADTGLSEFEFNEDLALRIEKRLEKVKIQRIYRRTYNELPSDINALKPDFVVSLHCNAYDTKASGTEVLYYHKSEKGKQMASVLQAHLLECLHLPDRNIKPKSSEDRGGYLLRNTDAPCVIAEPFFIDNNDDLSRAQEDMEALSMAYVRAIEQIGELL